MKAYQQGDVILAVVDNIPKGAKKVAPSARGYVLAEGETTGHAHVLTQDKATETFDIRNCELYEKDGEIWVKVKTETPLKHEEHNTITISPGKYKVGRVVEVDPFENEIRTVRD